MHSLPATFALWRLQGETVANLLFDSRRKRQSKVLKSVLKVLDQIWTNQFGDLYVGELVRLIDLHQKDAALLDDTGVGGNAANDDDFGLVACPSTEGNA